MTRKEFEELVVAALNELPPQFKDKLENVDVVIEDEIDSSLINSMRLGSRGRLLGLYQGVPLKKRTHYYGMVLPDKITIFKNNIEKVCDREGLDIRGEVKHVLEHEIAHHFGITDKRLKDLDIY